MAEVVLLIVFALLMALAAVWKVEHQQKLALEKQLNEILVTGSVQVPGEKDRRLLAAFHEVMKSIDPDRLGAMLEGIRVGQNVVFANSAEAKHLSDIRDKVRNSGSLDIDRMWRELVAASSARDLSYKIEVSEAVERTVGRIKGAKVANWIALGQQAEKAGEHNWPPIINLREDEGYTFTKNRADLDPKFEAKLKAETIPELIELMTRFRVDVIEVVGHTDEQAIAQRMSNLDTMLLEAARGSQPVGGLVHADNAGLGLARAVSVVRALLLDGRLAQHKYRLLPLPGGQLIETDERLTAGGGGDAPSRRRIEIRLRRSQESLGRRQ